MSGRLIHPPWLITVLAALLLLAPAPPRAHAVPGPCDIPLVANGCEVVGDAVKDAAGSAAQAAGDAALGALTGWVGDGAAWLLSEVATAIDATTTVDLGAPWFAEHYDFMFGVGALLLLPLVLLTVLQALLRQDPRLLVRVAFLHLPAAVLLTGLAVAVTQTALAVTDALSRELTAGIAEDTGTLAQGLAMVSVTGSGVPLFAAFILALVMALAALFVWFELVLRAAAIYIAVMFLPLFLAAMIWPATSGWIRRLVQLLVAAVLSKLVIVATLSLGLSAFASADSPSAVLAGAGMFMLAAFSPFVLFSLLPLVADAAQPQRESRQALATATGASLTWNVARARMNYGAGGSGRAFAASTRAGMAGSVQQGRGDSAPGGVGPVVPGDGRGVARAGTPGASARPGPAPSTTSAAAHTSRVTHGTPGASARPGPDEGPSGPRTPPRRPTGGADGA